MLCQTSILYEHIFLKDHVSGLSIPLFSPKAWWLHPPVSHRSLSFLLDPLLPTASGLAKYANVLKCKRSPSFLWPVSQNELLTREDQSLVCFSLFHRLNTDHHQLLPSPIAETYFWTFLWLINNFGTTSERKWMNGFSGDLVFWDKGEGCWS